MSETTLIVLGAIGFLAAGIGLGFLFSQLRMRGQSAKAGEVQQQFDDYKREVTQHFGQTADHFKAIGREYRELYEHMAEGADSLCDREALDTKLSFAPKAILESIAEERKEPEASEQESGPVAAETKEEPEKASASGEEAEPTAAEAKEEKEKEKEKAPATDSETAKDDSAARTLH